MTEQPEQRVERFAGGCEISLRVERGEAGMLTITPVVEPGGRRVTNCIGVELTSVPGLPLLAILRCPVVNIDGAVDPLTADALRQSSAPERGMDALLDELP